MNSARASAVCALWLVGAGLGSVLLGGCVLSDDDLRAQCAAGPQCVESRIETVTRHTWDFEGGCIGDGCDIQPLINRPVFGPSWHPSERALVLPAGTTVSLPFSQIALSDGTQLVLNARCSAGATLWFDRESMWDGRVPLRLSGPQGWHRFDQVLRTPTVPRVSTNDVTPGQHAYALQLRVTGTGECAVDRAEHRVLARVCVRWWPSLEQCARVGGWDGGGE